MQIDTPEELWKIVNDSVPKLVTEANIRLLVVDSVGGLSRTREAWLGSPAGP